MKQKTIFRLSLIAAVCGLLILQSCEKDPVTPPVDNSANVKPYILINGFKYFCAKQTELRVKDIGSGDSTLVWSTIGASDTTLLISHNPKDIKVGTYGIDSSLVAPDPGFVCIRLRWGNNIGSPLFNFAKGSYELKRENGKYVSYLKGGEAWNKNDHSQRVKNVEFKVVWPH